MMPAVDLPSVVADLLKLPSETEWVEFKCNNESPQEIGEYVSAISNGAALHGKETGYIVWGVDDRTHQIAGTSFSPKTRRIGNEELENWLLRLLNPRVDLSIQEFQQDDGRRVVMFAIQAANSTPVRFSGEEFIRVGSYKKKLKDYPEKERRLWQILSAEANEDWSARVVEGASLRDLDAAAISFARRQYLEKFPQHAADLKSWDAVTFLNKAKVCTGGRITRCALLLLGKPEAAHYLLPSHAQITWVLKDERNQEKDYEHIDVPFLLAGDRILQKIRNLTVRQLPSGTLFPHEMTQYDPWVIRETLHNCIAHQNYPMGGKINVVEAPEALLFSNLGSFIPGTVEEMIQSDAPPHVYRNRFLAQAMVNLNMIDTIGSGIKRMFRLQKERSFPMPDYDLSDPRRVTVRLAGQVLDENYSQLLLRQPDLDLLDVIALDRVQKKRPIEDADAKRLRARGFLEGRRPNFYVSAKVAEATGDKAAYIKNRAFDKAHYKLMVQGYLKRFGQASRAELDQLLLEKLSDALDHKQKKAFITNLLQEMKKSGEIEPSGSTRWAQWRLSKAKRD